MRPQLAGKCVLIVEDDRLIALNLEDLLTAEGASVAGPFPSCAEAADFLKSHRPDLAILDIELTDGLSYPVADLLTALEVRFVVTSGRLKPDPRLARAPFLPKPYPRDQLLTTLRMLTLH